MTLRIARLLAIVLPWSSSAWAEGAPDMWGAGHVPLAWSLPAGCDVAMPVTREVPTAPELQSLGVVVTGDGQQWQAHVVARYGYGVRERRVSAETCAGAVQAAELLLSLLLGGPQPPSPAPSPESLESASPSLESESLESESPPAPSRESALPTALGEGDPPVAGLPVSARAAEEVGLQPAPDLGAVAKVQSPQPSAGPPVELSAPLWWLRGGGQLQSDGSAGGGHGVVLALEARQDHWGFRLNAGLQRPWQPLSWSGDDSERAATTPSASWWSAIASLEGCYVALTSDTRPLSWRPALWACAGPSLTRVEASSRGVTDPATDARYVPGAVAGLNATAGGPGLGLWLGASALLRFAAVGFELAPQGTVAELSPVGAAIAGGVRLRL